ncbi:MopE-related protein [Flavobacterium silvaticum]|uniref:T9SS type A sorting domain-containing protein n=1 Tax=Flavobacterium silvaticum TaxID=1852020 RepID=A0A972JHP8_9FLAO|nr:MopE-related protein [Flavobacterium silvaticum]NMH28170.1 T9SS type A sorting domain-containing protein [Flavobacterium silvaticum]
MKRILLLIAFVLSISAQAQKTWNGSADSSWNVGANWTPSGIPDDTDDVIIPTGSTVNLNVNTSIKSLSLQGTAVLDINANLAFSDASSFSGTSTVNWNSNSIAANGVLSASGTINFITGNTKYLSGILNNSGTINSMEGVFYLQAATVNNSGTIDFQGTYGTTYSGANVINNSGTIKKTSNTGECQMVAAIHNTGTIAVQSGSMTLNNSENMFTGGVYNVSSGATLTTISNTAVSGTLTGNLQGNFVINSAWSVAASSTFHFTGTALQWYSGYITGGGTLNLQSPLHLTSGNTKYVSGGTTISNTSTLTFSDTCALQISDGSLNNQVSGIIDIASDGSQITYSGGIHHFTNSGLLKKTGSTSGSSIVVDFTNTGTIQVASGILVLNAPTILLDGGIYTVSAGAQLENDNTMIIQGNLTGVLNGPFQWSADVNIIDGNPATLSFTGASQIYWYSNSVGGGGILNNTGNFTLTSGNTKYISGGTTLNNSGTIYGQSGAFSINSGVLNNLAGAIFDWQSDYQLTWSGSGSHVFNNYGLLKKTIATGENTVYAELHNYGTLQMQTGSFNLNNTSTVFHDGSLYNISSGASIKIGDSIMADGMLGGTLNGDFILYATLNIPASTTFNFGGNTPFKWYSGTLSGGGTLNVSTPIEFISGNTKYLEGGTTVNNTSTVLATEGAFSINNGVFNNQPNSIFDLKSDYQLTWSSNGSHVFNNHGLIRKTEATGNTVVYQELHNDGTIDIQSGSMNFSNDAIVLGTGTYNVSSGALLELSGNVNLQGTLSGTLDGTLRWNGNLAAETGAETTFNFGGSQPVSWFAGSLVSGTLNLNSPVQSISGNTKYISGESTLNVSSTLAQTEGSLSINDGTLNTTATGIFDFQSDYQLTWSGSGSHVFNNHGQFLKSNAGSTVVYVEVNNYGIIQSTGAFNFTSSNGLDNTTTGVITGTGSILLPSTAANFTNDGTFAPGGNPGTLAVSGFFKGSESSRIAVDLNGTDTADYDLLAIDGNSNLAGSVTVNLGFAPALHDSFTVATSDSISSCELQSQATAAREGLLYTFSVSCQDNNKVVLEVIEIVAVPPVVPNQEFCQGATVADLQAEGTDIKWYANASGGSALSPTTLLTSGSYYATQTIGGFESERVAVTVTVNATPQPVAASPQDFVGTATVADLAATGSVIQWYAALTGGSALSPDTALSTGTYYVTQTLNSCESTRKAISITVSTQFPFYADEDGDGFGTGETVLVTADGPDSPPAGYSLDGSDCDDTNASVYQNTEYYVDADGDGYDNGQTTVCHGAGIPDGYSDATLGTDCDDTNAALFAGTTFFIDTDDDGYDAGTAVVCAGETVPDGYAASTLGTDCDDSDATAHAAFDFFVDEDGDGFGSTVSAAVCTADAGIAPSGYSLSDTDCNDSDATIYQSADVFIDMDADGYDAGSQTICYGSSLPEGFSAATLGTDCDDTNGAIFQGYDFYVDSDNDGFGLGEMVNVCTNNPEMAPEGYSLNNSDCDDQNALVHQGFDFYTDADSDGFGSGEAVNVCAENAGTAPTGYATDNSDCNDFDATIYQNGQFFTDEDGDGYSPDDSAQTVCYGSEVPEGYAETTSGMDCDDQNASANPGAQEIPGNGIDDNCNGTIDEGTEIPLTQVAAAQCGATLESIGTPIHIDPVIGATAYRVRVTKPNGQVLVYTGNTPEYNLMYLPSIAYGATYSLAVQIEYNGTWTGIYGPVCQVTSPPATTPGPSVISQAQCGGILPTITTLISTQSLNAAQGYRYRITNLTDPSAPNQIQVITRPQNFFSLQMLASYAYGTTYQIEISTLVNGIYTEYGSPCTIETPAVPALSNCNAMIPTASTTIATLSLLKSNQYRFELTDTVTSEVIVVNRPTAFFTFNNVPGYASGRTYNVRVSVHTADTWSPYGPTCSVTAPGAARQVYVEPKPDVASIRFAAVAYPSPFATEFSIKMESAATEKVQVRIFDMTGKLLQDASYEPSELELQQFGSSYPAGVYNVIISQKADVKTLRIVKR